MELHSDLTGILSIDHIDGSSPPTFRLIRLEDGKALAPVTISSPYNASVDGRPTSNLMSDLRWYLEHFLEYPFSPDTHTAENILDGLKKWGAQAFNLLFDRRDASTWLDAATVLQVRSDDPIVLSWPWEALFDPLAGSYLAHKHRMERRINKVPDPPPVMQMPRGHVNILLVVARPYDDDISYRSVARPIIDLIALQELPAHVDVLRPPTFDQLREHLRRRPGFYHILHFDGHGTYGVPSVNHSSHQFRGQHGCLIFELEHGGPDPKSAQDLSVLLREHALPAVVLNACQSATLDERSEDAFASVATSLLRSGIHSVVAMGYSLYVSGAQVFLPSFYRRLFESGSVAEGVRAGRQEMLANKYRVSARGPYPLEDWLLPVLYQQSPFDFSFEADPTFEGRTSRLPTDLSRREDEYGFVGRDGPILEMERALQRRMPCILIQGLSGIGKTTLVVGFLRWLDQTGGLDGALWVDFREIRSAEYVFNLIGHKFYGETFAVAPNKLELLTTSLKKLRFFIVWDNFESATMNLTPEDRRGLSQFLDAIRGAPSKVIITSRSREEWLGPTRRFELNLGGLDGEERWQYCDMVSRELRLNINRNDPDLIKLMSQLNGHPLAMRVLLPNLQKMSAASVAKALHTNVSELGLDEQDHQTQLYSTLRFVEQGLRQDLRPLMSLVALHEHCLDLVVFEAMAKEVDPCWTREMIVSLLLALEDAGLVRSLKDTVYELHPLLTSYLRKVSVVTEPAKRAFVETMAVVSSMLAATEQSPQRQTIILNFSSNFYYARDLAKLLAMKNDFAALTFSVATYASSFRDLTEASRLLVELLNTEVLETNFDLQNDVYFEMGIVAADQRTFDAAEAWFKRSLALSETLGNSNGLARNYHQLGKIFLERRDFATADSWFRKSLEVREKQGNLEAANKTLHELGRIHEEQGNLNAAWTLYTRSYDLSAQRGDEFGMAMTSHHLGTVALELGDFSKAQKYYQHSLEIKQKHADLQGSAITYHQLGRTAESQGDLEMARSWYMQSLDIKEKQGNRHGAAITYHQLGVIAFRQDDFGSAKQWALKALTIFEEEDDLHGIAKCYHQLGTIASQQLDFAQARKLLLQSLAIKEKQYNLRGATVTYLQLALIAVRQGQIREFGTWIISYIAGCTRLGDTHSVGVGVRLLSGVYERAGAGERKTLLELWEQVDLGPFPVGTSTNPDSSGI